MNSDIKAKWVSALRSGDYVKAVGHLYVLEGSGKESYCVLGVLTKLYCNAKEKDILKIVHNNNSDLTKSVKEWAELESSNPKVLLYDEAGNLAATATSLVTINDKLDYTFDKLAEVIEKSL